MSRLKRGSLSGNVTALYVLQIASYVLPLLTIPFLVASLGVEGFGALSKTSSMMLIGVLLVDSGFNTRAVRALAAPNLTLDQAQHIYLSTQALRGFFLLLVTLGLGALSVINPTVWFDRSMAWACYLMVLGTWLYPTWLFQGLEVMHFTTLCSLGGRLLACGLIVCLIRTPDGLILAAYLQSGATLISGIFAQFVIVHRLHLRWRISWDALRLGTQRAWRESKSLFGSEFFTNVGAHGNAFFLGFFVSDTVVGAFSLLEKIARAMLGLLKPVVQALLPRVTRDYQGSRAKGIRIAKLWKHRLVIAGIFLGFGFAGAGTLAMVNFPEPTMIINVYWLVGMSCWLVLATFALAQGQLMCLGLGRALWYSKGLWWGSAIHLFGAAIGAWLAGVTGLIVAMIAAELIRFLVFSSPTPKTTARTMSCES